MKRAVRSPLKAVSKIVGIGASAGGLEAFTELLRNLPLEGDAAYVLVQHLDPTHRSLLSELLARTTTLPVREIEPDTKVEAGQVYVIPPNCDLALQKGVLKLTPREKNSGPARTIDRFLRSLAGDQKEHAIGVILSGAGSDGAKGLAAVKDAGGITFAQDEASSKYDSMPRSAIATGCVDFVLTPEKIAAEIGRILTQPRRAKRRAAANARQRREALSRRPVKPGRSARATGPWPAAPEDLNLRKIFVLLRGRTGTDFSFYRPNTIRRRLSRRLTINKVRGLEAYVRFLREHPTEIDALYQDLLINVTSFFRNPSVFETLKKKVFPKLVRHLGPAETLRCWVAGCSTGQEAYSIAIAYAEFAQQHAVATPLQIFATDLNTAVLDQARSGRYTRNQIGNISSARLQRFFLKEADGYRVQKALRDTVIFAQHNLLSDPPFTRVDLITCRNLLIYFEPTLQQRIIPAFHYALKPGGHLVLGTSESVGHFGNLFDSADKSHKLYAKKNAASWIRYERPPPLPSGKITARPTTAPRPPELNAADAFKEADRLTLARYAPTSVLVNEDGEILQFRGETQRYLELPSGKANFNVFKMSRQGLSLALQRAFTRARRDHKPAREKDVVFGSRRTAVHLEVVPLKNLHHRCYLVLFEPAVAAAPDASPPPAAPNSARLSSADTRRYTALKREHTELREEFENLREQHDTSIEELQASNEEVQSANEELQSLNEELETSNEELESANEELTTLNEELATRNNELRESEARLREQAELLELAPVLARSPKDRIIFWNRGTEKLYGFTKEDALGQTAHILLGAKFSEPLEKIHAHLQRHGHWEGEVIHRHKEGHLICVAAQWVAHHDAQKRLRAVLEVHTDITARKKAEQSLRESEEFNRRILESSPDCVKVLDLEGRIVFMNQGGLLLMEIPKFEQVANGFWPGFWEGEARTEADGAYRAAAKGKPARFRGLWRTAKGTPKWWDVVCRPILGPDGKPQKILAISRDVTEHKHAELTAAEEARLAALRADVATAVARPDDLHVVLQDIAGILAQRITASFARIWSFDPETRSLDLRASAGLPLPPDQHARVKLGEGPLGQIAASRRPLLTNDLAREAIGRESPWTGAEKMVSFAGYPLLLGGRLLGIVALYGREPLEPRVLHELSLTADSIAHFIHRKSAEQESARLYREAVEARNEAVAASQAKDDFLATLSHELRTPLNPVLMLASDGAENPAVPDDVRATFKTIVANVSLEARLIDDLLDLTRITHGKLSLEMKPIDAHATLRDAIGVVANDIEHKHVSLVVTLDAPRATVIGDAVRLQQVFWNVLNNAVKFTPPGGRIVVQSAAAGNDRLSVRISDSGIGLTQVELDKIFSAFSQGEHRLGGLGLGLAISRQLLDKHGGRIAASSPGPKQGATFEIELPLARETPVLAGRERDLSASLSAPADGHTPPPFAPAFRRILLVEDHDATRVSLQHLLSRRRFDVVAAASVSEACQRAQEQGFDLVISDLGLPDGDGCGLWKTLSERNPNLVGIALSGYGMEEDIARSRAAGFAQHLTKPVDVRSLDRAIARVSNLVREPS